jgi:hypothetical protein
MALGCEEGHVVRQTAYRAMTTFFISQYLLSLYGMYLVAIAWIYVVLMMAVAEATSSNGTVLGAVFTFVLYGALPLAIVLYVMATPQRRRTRRAREAAEAGGPSGAGAERLGSSDQPDGGDHAAGDPVAPEREEP